MTIMQISIISLICIGAFACVIALIYTKLIKPNTFGYTNKNMLEKKKYINLINKLNSLSKVYSYHDLTLVFDNDRSKPIVLDRLLITVQNVYIISNTIEKKVIDINKENNRIKLIYTNKKLDLPLDINLLLANAKRLKDKFNLNNNIKIIIPLACENFHQKDIDNISFVQENMLFEIIKKTDDKPSELSAKDFNEQLKQSIVKKKPKRTFMYKKTKEELDF